MSRGAMALVVYSSLHIQFLAVAAEHWEEHRFWIIVALVVWTLSSPSEDS